MATRLTRSEQTERNRALVLEAARRVFLARGYAGASVDAIADEAGFSKGVVYSQFAGKSDVLFALLDARIEERAAENAERAAGLAGADGLRTLLRENARLGDEVLAGIAARGGLRLVLGPRDTAQLILALAAGVTLERTADPLALPEAVVEELATRLGEPI
jgi:AcrR family transcriptional regulator